MRALLVGLGAFAAVAAARSVKRTKEAMADKIKTLPDAPEVAFDQFSGYLQLEGTEINSFYWYTECSECDDPDSAPLAFWTNGGPGCSGLIGFMTENGAFRPQPDGTLAENEYAWNKVANTLFVEQPVGVGFSYSTDKSDYRGVSDSQAAEWNYKLLVAFLQKFPELAANELYLTAESYGGHYLPTLANYILKNDDGSLNFKGLAVGNPYTDPNENAIGTVETIWGHQLVPKPTYDKWAKACKVTGDYTSDACTLLQAKMWNMQMGNLNPYALDYPVCLADDGSMRLTSQQARMAYATYKPKMLEALGLPGDPEDYDPCVDDYATTYLNRPDVKEALGANANITWAECSSRTPYGTLIYDYLCSEIPMEPIWREILDSGKDLKLLIISGDDDSVCGTIGTQSWIYDLGPAHGVKQDWQAWTYEGQVAGYITKFHGFSFATVHGAGHEVPTYKPAQSLHLMKEFFDPDSTLIF